MVRYSNTENFPRPDKPVLSTQLAGGFNFGTARSALEIRNDPHTAYIFMGEEIIRAARLWTNGYDLYVPNNDIIFHWYEKRHYMWDHDWGTRSKGMERAKRRIRHILGAKKSSEDFDHEELDVYGLGDKRTIEQFWNFTGVDFDAPWTGDDYQFDVCGGVSFVPFDNSDEEWTYDHVPARLRPKNLTPLTKRSPAEIAALDTKNPYTPR